MKQSNSYTFYCETESHSGRRRCVTPSCNLAKFDYVALFGEVLTENFEVVQSRFTTPHQFRLPNFLKNNWWSFPESPKLSKAFWMPIWFQIPFTCQNAVLHITTFKIKCFFFLALSCHFTSLRSWQRHPPPQGCPTSCRACNCLSLVL